MKYTDPHRKPFEPKKKSVMKPNIGDWVMHTKYKRLPISQWEIIEVTYSNSYSWGSHGDDVNYQFEGDIIYGDTSLQDETDSSHLRIPDTRNYIKLGKTQKKLVMKHYAGIIVGHKVGIL